MIASRGPSGGWEVNRFNELDAATLAHLSTDRTTVARWLLQGLSAAANTNAIDPVTMVEATIRQRRADQLRAERQSNRVYTLWLGLALQWDASAPRACSFDILSQRLYLVRQHIIDDRFQQALSTLPGHLTAGIRGNIPETLLITRVTAHSGLAAYNLLEQTFLAWRGLAEFALGSFDWQFSTNIRPLSRVTSSSWCLASCRHIDDNDAIKIFNPSTTLPTMATKPPTLSVASINHLKLYCKKLQSASPSSRDIGHVMASAMRLYAQALDQPFPADQFLGLWQVCEAIALTKPGQHRGESIPHRLAWFQTRWDDAEPIGVEALIESLSQLRNSYVHKGISTNIDQDDVNVLKFICDTTINMLMKLILRLPTKDHLDLFYRAISRPETEKRIIKQVLELVDEL